MILLTGAAVKDTLHDGDCGHGTRRDPHDITGLHDTNRAAPLLHKTGAGRNDEAKGCVCHAERALG